MNDRYIKILKIIKNMLDEKDVERAKELIEGILEGTEYFEDSDDTVITITRIENHNKNGKRKKKETVTEFSPDLSGKKPIHKNDKYVPRPIKMWYFNGVKWVSKIIMH